MKIVDYSTIKATMGETRTVQDFSKFLGNNPHKLGLVASLYKDLTATYLTDSLMNIYFNEKKGNTFQPINSMMFEWNLDVNYIKKVYFAEDTTQTGANKSTIRVVFTEKYYDKWDSFKLENQQILIVTQVPRMLAPSRWEYICVIQGNNIAETLDLRFAAKGRFTRYLSNYHPELSERGYAKYHSNTEMHRNYLSLHRSSESWSQQYAVLEPTFIQVGKGGTDKNDMFYKLSPVEKVVLDNFYISKNNNMLFGRSNYDVNGKCLVQDDQGRDLPSGDGIIPQIERYCDKLVFSNLSVPVFEEVIHTLKSKSANPKGNKYTFIINSRMDLLVNKVLREYLRDYDRIGTYFFSKSGKNVAVGANFDTYMIAGNEITFVVDRCLDHEYENKALNTSALAA
jgi:hypothetical protein